MAYVHGREVRKINAAELLRLETQGYHVVLSCPTGEFARVMLTSPYGEVSEFLTRNKKIRQIAGSPPARGMIYKVA